MRTDFTPVRFFNPLAIASAVQAGIGAIQGIAGAIQQKRALKKLEKLQTPTYTKSQSILDFYNKALQRYNVAPYSTSLYKKQNQDILRGTATGLSALGDRRSGLSGVNKLVGIQNDALLKAGATAEGMRDQRFSQLGGAAGMKAGEDRMEFQVNKMLPYEKQYNLLAAKAGGGANIMNAGISNIGGGLQSMSQMGLLNQLYGGGESAGGMGGGSSMVDWDSPRYRNRIGG